jgi:hypothetical protein
MIFKQRRVVSAAQLTNYAACADGAQREESGGAPEFAASVF